MKKFQINCMIALFIILCFSCRKNKNEENVHSENEQEISIVNQEIYVVNIEDNQDTTIKSYPIEKESSWGITCYTNITDNNVNVRISPSLDSKVVYKLQTDDIVEVRGFSNETMTIDDYYGNWVNIHFKSIKSEFIEGWVFSKYVNIGDKKPVPIKFVEILPDKWFGVIKLSYNVEGKEIFGEVGYSMEGNYYVFIWGSITFGYHYRCKPGIYFLNKDTYELKHFTYSGAFSDGGGIGWVSFTKDFEYVIQDSGTSSGIRGITAWRCSTNELIYQGIYYRNSRTIGHTIDVVYMYDDWYYERGRTDDEIMEYGKKFTAENPVPEDIEKRRRETGLHLEIIINCTINLDTGERTIKGGEYILTQ